MLLRRSPRWVCDRSIPPPPLLLGRLACRIASIARGLLLGEQRGVLFFFLRLELRHDGGLLGGDADGRFGGLAGGLGFGLRFEPRGFGARGFLFSLLARTPFLALASCFGDRLQLRLTLLVFLVTRAWLFLEPFEQGFLGLRSSVEALLHAGAFGATPHRSSSFASGWHVRPAPLASWSMRLAKSKLSLAKRDTSA